MLEHQSQTRLSGASRQTINAPHRSRFGVGIGLVGVTVNPSANGLHDARLTSVRHRLNGAFSGLRVGDMAALLSAAAAGFMRRR
jgi:hypothetical protein